VGFGFCYPKLDIQATLYWFQAIHYLWLVKCDGCLVLYLAISCITLMPQWDFNILNCVAGETKFNPNNTGPDNPQLSLDPTKNALLRNLDPRSCWPECVQWVLHLDGVGVPNIMERVCLNLLISWSSWLLMLDKVSLYETWTEVLTKSIKFYPMFSCNFAITFQPQSGQLLHALF
jgi:hypothetical protein